VLARLGLVIFAMTAIAVSIVHIRRAEVSARHEMQRLETQQIALRRQEVYHQSALEFLLTPTQLQERAKEMSLDLRSHPFDDGTPGDGSPRAANNRPRAPRH
jgi:hypothetical protein